MPNGRQPQTDREWLMQIDASLTALRAEVADFKKDESEIFGRLGSLEKETVAGDGRCALQDDRMDHFQTTLDKIPSVGKAIRFWALIFTGIQLAVGGVIIWKGV